MRHRVLKTLGREDELKASGQLEQLMGSFARLDPPLAGGAPEVGRLLLASPSLEWGVRAGGAVDSRDGQFAPLASSGETMACAAGRGAAYAVTEFRCGSPLELWFSVICLQNASTTVTSNWVPAWRLSSSSAASMPIRRR